MLSVCSRVVRRTHANNQHLLGVSTFRQHAAFTSTTHHHYTFTLSLPTYHKSSLFIRSFSTPSSSSSSTSSKSPLSSSSSPSSAPAPVSASNKSLIPHFDWPKVKKIIVDGIHHFWVGTKLLVTDTKVAFGLFQQVLRGHELTRRERKQLLRTSADLLRFVPFLVIVIVPFAEFALPILLRLFPNMLPSTYLDSKGEEVKLQKQLVVKMEMARFLQETTGLLASQLITSTTNKEVMSQAKQFGEFMTKVKSGQSVTNEEILKFTQLFDSEFTLENLSRDQLVAMCKLLGVKAFGNDWVLRYKINSSLRQIRKDDEMIQAEGVESLSESELQEACRARGIHPGKSLEYMRRKLQDWLELSLEKEVPITLLILSRAFSKAMTHDDHTDPTQDLASTLAYVPEVVIAEAEKSLIDQSVDINAKLKLLEQEAQLHKLEAKKKKVDVLHSVDVAKADIDQLKEENEDIEEDIDETIEVHEKVSCSSPSPPPPPTAAPAPVTPTLNTLNTHTTQKHAHPAVATTPASTITPANDIVLPKKKVIAAIDKLNDRVGDIIEQVEREIQNVEKKKIDEKTPEKKE